MNFSERKGMKPVRQQLQCEGMDDALRASLWNALHLKIWDARGFLWGDDGIGQISEFSRQLWFVYFKRPIDEIPAHPFEILSVIQKRYFSMAWNEVYDFLESVVTIRNDGRVDVAVNYVLTRELAGYRLINHQIVDVTDPNEIAALEEALSDYRYRPVRQHLARAMELLVDRKNPDYRNSMKESISAVESMAKLITGKERATLPEALHDVEKSGALHSALREGFVKLYGYTSDADGIRHAMLTDPNLTAAEAKFFLLSCTSFVNYLKSKA